MPEAMTVRGALEQKLFEHGMFPAEAKAVMDRVVAQDAEKDAPLMANRWSDAVSGYPPQLLVALWLAVKPHALEWIDANAPKAWYREAFTEAANA